MAGIVTSYKVRRELDELTEQDAHRKQLIRLAVLRIVSLGVNTQTAGPSNDVEELNKKCLNYEMTINRLKQEWNTKDKLNESKMDRLKEENTKLKSQLKRQPTSQSVTAATNYGYRKDTGNKSNLSFTTSPYLSRAMSSKSYLSPTLNSINKATRVSDPWLASPIQNKRRPTFGSQGNQKTFGTQIKNSQVLTPRKPNTNADSSPGKSPSRLSFVENFDRSDSPKSPNSPEDFTPTKRAPYEGNVLDAVVEEIAPNANSTTIMDDSELATASQISSGDDIFTSANSTLVSNTEPKDKQRKSKTLNLAASSRKVSKGVSVDHDANVLDYYKDDNIVENDTPKKKREIRHHKKQSRVFSVEESP